VKEIYGGHGWPEIRGTFRVHGGDARGIIENNVRVGWSEELGELV
jgi:hypothetical protein